MRWITALALALLVQTAGCGEPPPGAPSFDVGTGASAFSPIADGDTLLLVRGCQGLQHVWITLRATDIDPRGVLVDLSLSRASDGVRVSSELFIRLSFTPSAMPSVSELSGLTLVVPMPDDALDQDLLLEATITDRDGVMLSDSRTIRIAWGTEVCGI